MPFVEDRVAHCSDSFRIVLNKRRAAYREKKVYHQVYSSMAFRLIHALRHGLELKPTVQDIIKDTLNNNEDGTYITNVYMPVKFC